MSLEVALQNAISGLQTSKQTLQVISNNIANVNTEGYTRKIVEQAARVIEGTGFGVEIARISRNIDAGVLRQLRTATGTFEELKVKDDFLTQVNRLFGRPEDNDSIVHQISELGARFDSLAVSPETTASQSLTVNAAVDVVTQLKKLSDEIQRLRSDANIKVGNLVDEFNEKLDSVVSLNLDIIQFNASGISAAELEDQRDRALSRMSEIMDIKYFDKGDGSLTVFSGGGRTLVDGRAQKLSYNRPSIMAPTLEYTPTDATNFIAPGKTGYPVGGVPGIFVGEKIASQDITSSISNGQLKGLIDLRDTDLQSLQAQIDELSEKLKNEINRVHNAGAGFPPVAGMTGDRYVTSQMAFSTAGAKGLARVGIVDDSGKLIEEKVLDMSSFATVGDLVTALDGMTNLSASINSSGRLELSAQNNRRIAINELTSDISAAGDLNKGFSDFFGLNNFFTSTETFARYRSDATTSATAAAVTTAGTLQFTGNDGTAFTTTVSYSANASITALATAINANATLQARNISAQVIADGDNFRLQITDADGNEFAIAETGSGSALKDTGLRTDVRGLSNRLSVRSDIEDNSFFISRGALQSNTFTSGSALTISDPAAALSAGGVTAGGTLTFTINSSTTATVTYATTDSLNAVVTAIKSNATLQAANISAEVVNSAGVFSLKIVDADGDNYWVTDSQPSNGLRVDSSQGVTIGDGSVAANIAAAFNSTVTFLAAPARGGGLARTDATFVDYAANILAFNSSKASSVERNLGFQENLKNELFNKETSISGVNLDEELSNLVIFEQAYLASARMITTTQELFRALTDTVGSAAG